MERRSRSSLVLRTNSFAEASSAGPAEAVGAADEEVPEGDRLGPLEEDAQQRSRPARQGATTRMAAQTTRARSPFATFSGPAVRSRGSASARRRRARRTR